MKREIMELTDTELIQEYGGLYSAIYIVECYGTKDLIRLSEVCAELDKRGYKPEEMESVPNIVRKGG